MADEIVRIEADAEEIDEVINTLKNCDIPGHIADTNNPHQTTKEQVGLGNVDNTSDADKPLSAATKAVLAEIVDSGAKNRLLIAQGGGSAYNAQYTVTDGTLSLTSNGTYARVSFKVTLPAGDYVFSFNCAAYNATKAQIRFNTNVGGSGTAIRNDYVVRGTGTGNVPFTLSDTTTFYVIYYINFSSTATTTDTMDIAESMICTQAAWDVSQAYVPYRPDYDELIARIVALEQAAGINSVRSIANLAAESAADATEPGGEVM